MSAQSTVDQGPSTGVRPFVLKWAERAPVALLWSRQSIFSTAVNGLDISMVMETEKPETTGGGDTADTTHT